MSTTRHIAQLHDLAQMLSEPLRFPGDLRCDAAAITRHGDEAFVAALSPEGTQLFWFHLAPNPWGTLSRFLDSTSKGLPGVRYWLIGLTDEPIVVSQDPSAREILSHFKPSRIQP